MTHFGLELFNLVFEVLDLLPMGRRGVMDIYVPLGAVAVFRQDRLQLRQFLFEPGKSLFVSFIAHYSPLIPGLGQLFLLLIYRFFLNLSVS